MTPKKQQTNPRPTVPSLQPLGYENPTWMPIFIRMPKARCYGKMNISSGYGVILNNYLSNRIPTSFLHTLPNKDFYICKVLYDSPNLLLYIL